MEAVKALPPEIREKIDLRVWNVKTREGIKRKSELGAKCIPGIAVDNEMVFESTIPAQEDLIAAICRRRSRDPSAR
ncbi:MAG: hypothetical protein AB1556_06450 [Bacillota bacterium]